MVRQLTTFYAVSLFGSKCRRRIPTGRELQAVDKVGDCWSAVFGDEDAEVVVNATTASEAPNLELPVQRRPPWKLLRELKLTFEPGSEPRQHNFGAPRAGSGETE